MGRPCSRGLASGFAREFRVAAFLFSSVVCKEREVARAHHRMFLSVAKNYDKRIKINRHRIPDLSDVYNKYSGVDGSAERALSRVVNTTVEQPHSAAI